VDNVPKLIAYQNPDGTKPLFDAVSADADVDGDGKISMPTRFLTGATAVAGVIDAASPVLAGLGALIVADLHPDVAGPYMDPSECDPGIAWDGMMLGSIGARVAYEALRDISGANIVEDGIYIDVNESPSYDPQPNDFLVTRDSAEFRGWKMPIQTIIFVQGKMHGNVSDAQVGNILKNRGDVFLERK
jgi:hypothetical protein